MTQSQESRVSSTQDSLSLRPTEDSISSVSALVNKLSSCSGIYENEKSSYSSSGDEKKMQALLPWIKNFNSLCQSVVGCRSLKRLEKLLQIFWKNMSDPVKKSLKMTNRTAKLKKYMSEVLLFFHMSYLDLQEVLDNNTYLERMSDLVSMYIDMEIRASKRCKEIIPKVVSRLTSHIYIFLDNSEVHILDAILKARLINKNNEKICNPILGKVLNFVRPSTAPMYTMLYVRYLLAYKLWKKVVGNAEEKKRINKLAAVKLSAPTELTEKVVLWPSVLPKVPKSKKNVTLFLMQAKFDLKKSCQAFFKITKEKQQPEFISNLSSLKNSCFDTPTRIIDKRSDFEIDIGIDSSGNLFDGIWSLLCNVDSNTSDGTKTISPMGVKSERHISSTQKYKPKEKAPKKLKMKLINENKKPSSSNKVKKKTKCKKKNAIKPSDTLSVLSVKKGIKLPNNTTRKKKKNKFVKERLSVNFLTTALGTLSSSLSKPSMRDFISTSTSHSFSSSEEQSSSFGSISASLGSLPSPMERFTSAPLENVSAPVPIHSSPSSSDSLSSLPPPLEDLQIMSPSGISPLPPLDSELQRPAHLENNDLRKSFDSPSPSVPCPDTVAPSVASLTPSHPSAPLSPLTEDLQNKLELMDTEEGVQRMQEQETSKVAESNIPDVPEQSVVNKDIQNVSELTPPNISGVKLNCVSETVIQTTEALLALGVSEEMTLCVPELPQVEIKAEPEVENINKVIHAKPQALCVQKQNNVQQDSKIDLHNEISNLNITHSNDETTHNADQGSLPMQDGRLNIKVDVDSMENRDLSHETEISIANVKSSDTQYFDAPSNEVISEQTEICLQEEVVSQVEEEISTHSVEDGVSAIQINDTEHLYSSVSNHSFYHSEEHSTNLPEKTFTKSVINSNRTIDAEVALDKEVINRKTAQLDFSHVTPPMAIIPNSERNILFSTEDQCYAKKQSDLLTSNISKNTSDCIDRSNSESCPSNSATVGISLSELARNKLNKPQQQKINQTNITKKSIIHFDEQGSTSTNSLKGINANNSENNPITSTIETSVHKIMDSSLDFISANSKDVPIEVSVANKTVTNLSNSIKITNSITPNSIKEIPLIDVSSNEDSAGTLDSSDSVSDLATKIERTNVLDDSFVTNGNADSSSVILASNSALRCDFKSVISSQTTTVRLDPCDRLRAPTSSNNMINKTSHVDNEAVPITVNSKHLNQEKSTGLVSLTEDDGHSSDEPQIIGEERYCSADSSIKNESRSRSAFSDSQRGYYVEYDSDVEILEDIINNGINNNSGTSEGEEVISNVSNQTPRDDHGVFGLGPGELVMEVIGMSGPVSVIYSGSYAPREDLGQSSVDSESQPVHFDETEHFVDTTNLLDDTPRDRERDDYTYGRNSQDCLYRDVMLTGNRLNESGDTNYESFDFESYPLFQEDFMEGDEDDDLENTLVEDDLDSPIREGGRKYRSKNFALDSEKENSDGSPTSQGDIENVHTNNLTEENRRLFLAQQSERDNISVKTKPTDKSFPTVRFSDVNRYYPATLPSVQVDDVRNETKHDPPIKLSRTAKSLAAANEESAYLGRVTTVQLKQLPNQADPLLNLGQSIISKENLDAKLLGNESPAIPKRGMLFESGKSDKHLTSGVYKNLPSIPSYANMPNVPLGITYNPYIRCTCSVCYAMLQGSPAYNGQFHTQFRNTNIQRTVAENEALKSQDEELLKKIEESLSESARTKQEGIKDNFDGELKYKPEMESSLPLKKRLKILSQVAEPNAKTELLAPNQNSSSENLPSYPSTPMISIAELELNKSILNKLQHHLKIVSSSVNNDPGYSQYNSQNRYYDYQMSSRDHFIKKVQEDMYVQCRRYPQDYLINSHQYSYKNMNTSEGFHNTTKEPGYKSVSLNTIQSKDANMNCVDTKQFSGKTETSKRMFKTPAELKQISMPEDFVSSTVNLKSEPCLMPIPVLIPLDSKIDRTFNLGKRDCSGNPVNPPCEKLETKQGLDLTINKEIKSKKRSRRRKSDGETGHVKSSKRHLKRESVIQTSETVDEFIRSFEKKRRRKHIISRGRPKGVRGVGPNRDRGGRRKSPSLDENQERVENSPSKIYDGCKERVEKSPTQTFEKSYDRFKERVEKSLINCVNKSHTKCKERADKLSTECIDINEAECKERVATSTSPLLNFSPNLNSVGRNRGGFRGSGRKPSSAGHDSFNNSRGRRKIRGPRSRSPSNAPSLPNRSLIRGHGGGRGPRRRRSSSSSPSPPTLTRIHGSGKRPKKKMNRSSLDLGGGNRNTRLRSSSVSPSPPPILSRGHSANMGKKKLSPSPTSSRCDSPMPNLHMEFCPHRITRQMTANLSSSPCRPVKEDSSDEDFNPRKVSRSKKLSDKPRKKINSEHEDKRKSSSHKREGSESPTKEQTLSSKRTRRKL